jgi:histidyl-tRNA synthetase
VPDTAPDRPSASGPVRAPVGTHDVLPPESARWSALVATFADVVERAGYGLCQSPMFEDVGVFARVGAGTDVVTKEMYEFRDRGDRHLALRPEGTASVVRAFCEHRPTTPWKVWYASPVFRYERPQGGRYRQHHQLGVEAIGAADPDLDVEVMVLCADFYRAVGLRQVNLVVNTLGTPAQRAEYATTLAAWLGARLGDLDPADRERAGVHPLRVLDSKRPATRAVVADAPRIADSLGSEETAHFERVLDGLAAAGVTATVDHHLVRGLDYYTHTLFEFRSPALDAAQDAIGGGGRFDGLVEAMGGPPTPAVGFGTGIERVLLACDAEGVFGPPLPTVDVFVVDTTDGSHARALTTELRRGGVGADRAFDGRSMKSQMRAADRSGAVLAAIVGPDEAASGTVTLRPLRDGGAQQTLPRDGIVDAARAQVASTRAGVSTRGQEG